MLSPVLLPYHTAIVHELCNSLRVRLSSHTYSTRNNLTPRSACATTRSHCRAQDCAYGMPNTDLNTPVEKSEIHVFIEQSLNRLKGMSFLELVTSNSSFCIRVKYGVKLIASPDSDRKLPQVLRIKELLKRGIGVHHGGLLPIIKEVSYIPLPLPLPLPLRPPFASAYGSADGRNALFSRSRQSALCYGDFRDGSQYLSHSPILSLSLSLLLALALPLQ